MPWAPDDRETVDDCVRQAIAYMMDAHPRTVRFAGDPDGDTWAFWLNWIGYIRERFDGDLTLWYGKDHAQLGDQGIDTIPTLIGGYTSELEDDDRKWIAIVPSRCCAPPATHAVNMEGRKLAYDSIAPLPEARKQRPKLILFGMTIER